MRENGKIRYVLFLSILFLLLYTISQILVTVSNNENNLKQEIADDFTGELNILVNNDDKMLLEYTKDFEKQHPNLKVNLEVVYNYEDNLKQYFDNNYGDVLLIPNFISYKELNKYFEPLGNVDNFSRIYNFSDTKSFDNVVYGLPANANGTGFVYNKKVFEEAGITELPKTIDEFLQALHMIKDNTNAIPIYTNYSEGWAISEWEDFCYGAMSGDSDYKANKFVNEINPFSKGSNHYKVYKLLYDIVNQKLCESDPMNSNWEEAKKMMNAGKIGCMAIDSWAVKQIKNSGDNPDDISYMPFPNNINGIQTMTITADYSYGININSKNKEAAKAWINFIINESGYVLDNENISIVKSDPLPDALKDLKDCKLIIDNPSTEENWNRYEELSKNLSLNDYKEKQKIVDAALGNSEKSFDDIMYEMNERWESERTLPIESNSSGIVDNMFIKNNNFENVLTDSEKNYVDNESVFKVGYINKYYPIQYKGGNKEGFSGISADVFKRIQENVKWKFEYVPIDNVEEAIKMLEEKKIDMIAGLETSKNHNEFDNITLSKSYLKYGNIMVKNKFINNNLLDDWKIGLNKYGGSNYQINKNNITYYDDLQSCFKAVNSGKVDYTYSNFYTLSYFTRIYDLSNIVMVPMADDEINVSIGFGKDMDRKIISIINKVIYNLSNEDIQAIIYDNTEKYENRVSISKFIKSNYVLCMSLLIIINLIIISIFSYIVITKEKYNKKIMLVNKKYEKLSDLSEEYIFEFDYKNNKLEFFGDFEKSFAYPKLIDLDTYCSNDTEIHDFVNKLKKESNSDNIILLKSKFKERKEYFRVVYSIISDEDGTPINAIGKLINIDKEIEEKKILINKASNDSLTNLYNRNGFEEKVNKYINSTESNKIAFFIFDMDKFKSVNDTFGHKAGDDLLIIMAENLKKVFDENDIIGRWGGDEFLACVTENIDIDEIIKKAECVCELMDMDFGNNDNKISISVSAGVCYCEKKVEFAKLFESADNALYEVKQNGRNNYNIVCI